MFILLPSRQHSQEETIHFVGNIVKYEIFNE